MAPIDEIVVSLAPGESRFALLAQGVPVEFSIDRGGVAAGDLVLGRILSVNRALNAAFVEIGEAEAGFLAMPGAHGEGAAVLLQVTAAARGGKGAVLSAAPSLQGRLLAFTPARAGLNLSRRITDEARRDGLRQLLAPLLMPGEGLVVRTEAAMASDEALSAELAALRERWRTVRAVAAKVAPPARLEAASPLVRLLADHPSVRRLRTDDRAALAEVKALFPEACCDDGAFDRDVGESLEQALERRVPLPGGGALIIEVTAAFVAIDIDSGGGAPLAANLAAVPEIARQLRLRGLAGHILIDIIPLKDRQAQARLVAALRQAVAADPTPSHVVGVTPLGLIEMTRERRAPSLAEIMLDDTGPQRSAETLGLEGLRAALRAAFERPQAKIALRAAPVVVAALLRNRGALDDVARRLGRPLPIRAAPDVIAYEIVEDPR
jgi:ribonuclease E/ribonuclease G